MAIQGSYMRYNVILHRNLICCRRQWLCQHALFVSKVMSHVHQAIISWTAEEGHKRKKLVLIQNVTANANMILVECIGRNCNGQNEWRFRRSRLYDGNLEMTRCLVQEFVDVVIWFHHVEKGKTNIIRFEQWWYSW